MSSSEWTRRDFMRGTGAASAGLLMSAGLMEVLLAACSNGSTSTAGGTVSGDLEIFSWWTAGGEADGLNALYKVFNQQYPKVTIKNSAVAGGAGTNAKAVLATRMQGGKPPDSFQVHAGQELIAGYVKDGKMDPITDIWNSEGWDSVIPKGFKDIVSSNGQVWSVPVNIHRGNVLFYSVKALNDAGIQPPGSFDEFFVAMDKLKAKGMQAPLALGSQGNWQVQMLLENNVVAVGGADYYNKLVAGNGSWDDAKVKQALTYARQMLDYVNSDHTNLGWDDACKRLTDGSAAFTIMGDWAKGYFTANNWTADKDFGAVASPGTKGTYMIICDSFGLPKGDPNRSAAVAWLKTCGSRDGQAAFNPKKGSIPARTDVDKSLFDSISQRFIDEFKTDAITPSSAHGSATPPAFANGVNDEMGQFVLKKDVNTTAGNLQKLAKEFLAS